MNASLSVRTNRQNLYKPGFGRALRSNERKDNAETIQEARNLLDADGKAIFIVHDACLPQSPKNNTGVGNISSDESLNLFGLMKDYLGITHVETLPPGETMPSDYGFYCSYSSTALAIGSNQINLELLTKPEFAELLSEKDLKEVVDSNKEHSITGASGEKIPLVNYENVIGNETPHDKALKKAYNRLIMADNPKAAQLKEQFETYKTTEKERLEHKALFIALAKEHNSYDWKKWDNELDRNLYNPETEATKRNNRIKQLKQNHAKDVDFYMFKQFMADKHLEHGRQKLNDKGLKLIGDCLIGFSSDEVWAHQGAFKKGAYIGDADWDLPSLDYDKIHNPDGSIGDAGKLLKKKFEFFFKRYDAVRFDVGWAYVKPKFFMGRKEHQLDMGDSILKLAEKTAKEVKGEDYDLKNLMYEVEGGDGMIDWSDNQNPKTTKAMEGRVQIYSSPYMHGEGAGWGSTDFFINKLKFPPQYLVYGVGNHDPLSLRQLAEGDCEPGQKEKQIEPLSRFLGIPQEKLKNPKEFAKAKFAEVFTNGNKNQMFFYMDVLGRKERFDAQEENTYDNYRYKIGSNFEDEYNKKLQEGYGLNMNDALTKAFKAKGLDKEYPAVFNKLEHYAKVLAEKE